MPELIFSRPLKPADPHFAEQLARLENPGNSPTRSGGRQKRALAITRKLWRPGRTLKVSFLGSPDAALKSAIFRTASQWLTRSGANLALALSTDNDPRAQIRVRTGRSLPRNESCAGTDALAMPAETMNLNVEPGDAAFEHVVLHEFGHALGAEHEHQHPEASIPWNVEAVVHAAATQSGWTRQQVIDEMIARQADVGLLRTQYDPGSVMHYPVPQAFTHGDWEIGLNSHLSEKDLAFMRRAYPFQAAT
ncbi:M12 family metallopeptidase [Pseudomonas xantholysinigenes]|uniref:Peptidase M12 n=1 Tax=Pseudomonas xantholysinigenes TaxID=2745490 RepID=A0A9E6PUB2_9PSED|nr:M12 family metallopeptidase [Pseudomonas xantholysinigenes]QXI37411.1 peptidase M12 [Pseudomonas xantholysinigenes]